MAISKALKRAQENYIKRNNERKMSRVNVWVPEESVLELKEIAREMREEREQTQAN